MDVSSDTSTVVQEYMDELLNFDPRAPEATWDNVSEAGKICDLLTDRRRLARRPDVLLRERLAAKVEDAVLHRRPVKFTIPIGTIKNINSPTCPHIDWAEVFGVNEMLQLCTKIGAFYDPGATLTYCSVPGISSFLNNIPEKFERIYLKELRTLLDLFNQGAPGNVQAAYEPAVPSADLHKILDRVREIAQELVPVLNLEQGSALWRKCENNFMLQGIEDFGGVNEAEKEGLITDSVLRHEAFRVALSEARDNFDHDEAIPISHTGRPHCLHVRSIRGRSAAFWVSCGFLRFGSGKPRRDILHARRFVEMKDLSTVPITSPFAKLDALRRVPCTTASDND